MQVWAVRKKSDYEERAQTHPFFFSQASEQAPPLYPFDTLIACCTCTRMHAALRRMSANHVRMLPHACLYLPRQFAGSLGRCSGRSMQGRNPSSSLAANAALVLLIRGIWETKRAACINRPTTGSSSWASPGLPVSFSHGRCPA